MPSRAQILSGVELNSVKTVETAWQPLKLYHRGGVGTRRNLSGYVRVGRGGQSEQQSWEGSEMDSQIQAGQAGRRAGASEPQPRTVPHSESLKETPY